MGFNRKRLPISMKTNLSFGIVFAFAGLFQPAIGQASDSPGIDLSPRARGVTGIFAGFGVGGLRIGGTYHTTDKTSIEAGYGVVPFLGLSGKRAKLYSAGVNYYIQHDRVGTPVIGVLAVYGNARSTNGVFEEDLYVISPMVGFDYLHQSGAHWYVKAGGLLRVSHQKPPAGSLSVDLGVGWAIF